MDRFKIKIDNKIINKLINICRLCGIDNPQKVQIIEEVFVVEVDDEPSLVKKIYDLVGIEVLYNDGMPQMACSLCADKINDFYEYKEMCKATNLQTRNLLGLPLETKKEPGKVGRKKKIQNDESILGDDDEDYKPDNVYIPVKKQKVGRPTKLSKASSSKTKIDPKPEIVEDEVKIEDMLAEKEPNKRERMHELLATTKPQKKRKISLPAVDAAVQKKIKIENPVVCNVCLANCRDNADYEIHFYNFHVPHVQSFGCQPCAESFYTLQEQKDHHLWHRLSGTKYVCYKCNKPFERMAGFSRHLCSAPPPIFQINEIIPDLTCQLCKSYFPTENLYHWHDCFIKNNGECWRCKKTFVKKNILFRHVLNCKVKTIIVEPAKAPIVVAPVTSKATINISREGGRQKIVKSEPGSILEIEDGSQIDIPCPYLQDELLMKTPVVILERHVVEKKRRGRPKKSIGPVVEKVLKVVEPAIEQVIEEPKEKPIEQPLEQPPELEEMPIPESLTPIISSVTTLGIRIKQEVLNPDYGDFDANLARNIKKEKTDEDKRKARERKKATSPKPTLKLKIKKEHGTLNASFVEQQEAAKEKEVTSPLPELPNDEATIALSSNIPEVASTSTIPPTTTNITEDATAVAKPKSTKDKIRTHNKKKRIFKNPFAALAMKIKKERIDPKETISVPVISQVASAQDLVVPMISSVTSVSKEPIVRVKMEKPSPEHEVEYNYEEGEGEWEEEEEGEEEYNDNIPEDMPVSSALEETEKEASNILTETIPKIPIPASTEVEEGISEKLIENVKDLANHTEQLLDAQSSDQSINERLESTEQLEDREIETPKELMEQVIEKGSENAQDPDSSIPERVNSTMQLEDSGAEIEVPKETMEEREKESSVAETENIVSVSSVLCSTEDKGEGTSETVFKTQEQADQRVEVTSEIEEIVKSIVDSAVSSEGAVEQVQLENHETNSTEENSIIENDLSKEAGLEERAIENENSIPKTPNDVLLEEDLHQVDEHNVCNSKDAILSLEVSSDVVMTEEPHQKNAQTVLNCIESRLSPEACSEVPMDEESYLLNSNLEEGSNSAEVVQMEDSNISISNEISNLSHPRQDELMETETPSILIENTTEMSKVAEIVDETLNEIIAATVANSEPIENFNHKIIENHFNFPSGQRPNENNLEESQEKLPEKIVNNIHDLDDISSSSDGVQMNEVENNLLEGSPISSEPMSDAEEEKLLND